ncbi:putative sterigmatocystin biosynthesis monooxygenase stcW [Colletotrichum sp. SAR 10_70]|nr:putative sterigmatocystin biosynthesis monooxygenase stcW [Colletotrichum sp. SAR 10_71]KAI8172737.1 putative sterigmatocystin biosynthesis monooxygenase stcW [Colletotrichum sp. SAR 10_65]KAI8179266.1 putative sterigmatocystin biosynthesis monooxygenase stcW [Colletotrichum sp. SAR 10_70]KAI8200383.1 putative sterigmatocystin biosynthesis monooxygenase stcW [Colletotrichum sp. SAR 10_76]KAI8228397.1 putative sterigmatocystin biosynthesis monooxygenase stcW [Colletotrichum sp. SAR 10_86]KAJ
MTNTTAKLILAHPNHLEQVLEAAAKAGVPKSRIFQFSDAENETRRGITDWRHMIGTPTEADSYQWPELSPEESTKTVATINYSSGTTGLPKGVCVSHHNLIANVEQTIFMRYAEKPYAFEARPQERWVGFLPLYHAYGQLYVILMAVKLHVPVYIMKEFRYEDFLFAIGKYRITSLQVAPPILVMLSKRPETARYDLSSELIKVNALQVAPAELEAVLLENEHIADAAVVGIIIDGNEWPKAYVAVQEASRGKVKPEDIQEWVKPRVSKHKCCACDVPSHNYTWSFEPKLDWSAVYPPAPEIREYFESFARKYSLYQYIKLQHQVVGAFWNSKEGGYDVHVKDTQTGTTVVDHCDVLINAGGILNNWKWPAIPGLDKYKGTLLHTANWDDSVSLEGKHVGLIGNGSSGIQVLPAIRDKCHKVTTFIREPTWVSPVQGLEQHQFSPEELKDFREKPGALMEYRKNIESGLNGQFGIFLKNNKINQETHAYMLQQMKEKLNSPYLEDKLIPEWSVGCRRLTPGVNYLESLTKPNVEVVYGEITEVTERGCVSDNGQEYPVDILICATGFDTSFKPRFPVVAPSGENLQDKWAVNPESYFGMAASGFPNYFHMLGPNCPIGNGPVLSAIEAQADWMLKIVDRYQTNNIVEFAAKEEAVRDFVEYKEWFMTKTVWADPCRSWYKPRADGPVVALWPGSTLHYIEAIKEVRFDDLDVKYAGNRFSWLGNGYSQTELDDTSDWAYYIRDKDDDPPLTTAGKRKILTRSGSVKGRSLVSFSGKPEDAEPGPAKEMARL